MVAPRGKADFGELQPHLVDGAAVMRRIAVRAVTALLCGAGLDPTEILEKCVSESESSASVSVLNVYHYFNKEPTAGAAGGGCHRAEHRPDSQSGLPTASNSSKGTAIDALPPSGAVRPQAASASAASEVAANCPVHTDPGLVSVLARASAQGLQVAVGRQKVTACCDGTTGFHKSAAAVSSARTTLDGGEREDSGSGGAGDDAKRGGADEENDGGEWVCGESLYNKNQVMVIVGESLCRLTGFSLPASVHRVVHNENGRDRINAIFELRPAVHIFEEWGAKQQQQPSLAS